MLDSTLLPLIEGIAVVASPCILPILPIMLSTGVVGGKWRPYGIILGFVLCFTMFTLAARKLTLIFNLDLNLLRNISFGLLFLLGLVMLIELLGDVFSRLTQKLGEVADKWAAARPIAQSSDDEEGKADAIADAEPRSLR